MDTRMTLIAMALVVSLAGCNSIDSLPPLDAGRSAVDAQAVDAGELVDAAQADAYTPVAKVDAAMALPRGTRV
ncbi:MAG: hypothetical protein IT370_20995, partial [Deltaproteobacteria bacterium]|nr:hypothetical protein [Deltaproteobacteria bacterium]